MNWTYLILAVVIVLAFLALRRAAFVSAEAARQHLQAGAPVIDVRSPEEFNSGHVVNAVNIPLGRLDEGVLKLAPNKHQVLLVHCLSGGRSAMAKQQLKQLGYSNVYNLGSLARAKAIVAGGKPSN
ncbi:MAG: rhodanese-like domain-containing protein [Verrucomicrobiae bacterium]|nr:rhodanese-like domain-containing protein [Verrucomicrobiae bacterium]